jgi:signal transduction histidine kinase
VRFSPITRQVVFFALAVLVPAAMMVAVGVALMQKESELAGRRAVDSRTLVARQVGDSLFANLELAYSRAGEAPLNERYSETRPAVLILGRHEAGSFRSRAEVNGSAVARDFDRFMGETERAESSKGSGASLSAYRSRLTRTTDSVEIGYLNQRIGRALLKTGRASESAPAWRELLGLSSTIHDDFEVPFAYYGAKELIEAESSRVATRLAQDLRENRWISGTGLASLADLAPASPELTGLQEEHTLARYAADLPPPRGAALWQLDATSRWLVRTEATDTALVAAIRIDSLRALYPSLLEDVQVGIQESEDEHLLTPYFPYLVATVQPDAVALPGNQNRFFLIGLVAFLGLTVFGGYLLWRDIRRESRLSALRARFVSSVSHELRTPLTSIRLFAESMRSDGSTDDAERDRGLGIIAGESERLTRMLNNVLSTSQIEQGRMTYRRESGNLGTVVRRAADAMQYEFAPKGVELKVETEATPALLDADAIEQAVINLLSNALKYGASGGVVELDCRRNGTRAFVSVTDRGPGIPAEEQDAVFERYYRAAAENGSKTTGAGLGLALVKHIVEGHDGTVSLESEPGQGTTVTFEISLDA